MAYPKVSVNILNFNQKKYLKYCLDSLYNQTYPNFEILFIDNNSKDNSIIFVKKNYPQVTILALDKNLGYAQAHNIGIKMSRADFILCLNPDVILEKDYLKNIIDFLQKNEKAAACSGKILKWDFENNRKTNIIDSLGLEIFKSHRVVERGGEEIDIGQYDEICEVFGVSGAAPVYRIKALKEIEYKDNYFDKDFFVYQEDIDLSLRLRHMQWKIFYIPQSLAYHNRWETGSGRELSLSKTILKRRKKSSQTNFLSYRNHLIWLVKNEFLINLIIYFPWIFYYELKKFIYLLLFEQKTLLAFLDFLRLFPLTLKKRHVILSKSKIKARDLRKWIS